MLAEFLYTSGVIAACGALGLLFFLYRRLRQGTLPPARNPQDDLMNAMILFQTMRDLVHEQKELARQLNQSVDKKVTLIKETIAGAVADHQKLRKAQQDLALELAGTKTALASLQRHLIELEGRLTPSETELAPTQPSAADIAVPSIAAEPRPSTVSVRETVGQSELGPTGRDLIDNWVGLDFARDRTQAEEPGEPEAPPDRPEDPETARQAFRALLNLNLERKGLSEPSPPRAPLREPDGNGRGRVTPLQARVYEYNEAGMSVAEIARELGIGKGEVRLILSLRKDKEI